MKTFGEQFEEGVIAVHNKETGQARFIDAHISGIAGVWVAAANQEDCPAWFFYAHYSEPSRFVRGAIAWNRNCPKAIIQMMERVPQDNYVSPAFKFSK